ncbi:hypothetical protein Tco_1111110 [Tanacetum coccineum]|uniref:Reverse transcriptase domain-containing protein n=1 Tax=Tanacetum coccineum TaxID=301880 RepID=A0ABQ5IKP8_9ASTR
MRRTKHDRMDLELGGCGLRMLRQKGIELWNKKFVEARLRNLGASTRADKQFVFEERMSISLSVRQKWVTSASWGPEIAHRTQEDYPNSSICPTSFQRDRQRSYADEIHVDDKLNFIEEPVEIMDHEVKRLKQSRIPIVKVRWNSRRGPEYTWEREDQMKKKYLHLFANPAPASKVTS